MVKSFNEAMNELRKFIIKAFALTKSEKKKLMVKFKYLLAKRSSKRNEWEKQSLAEPADANKLIIQLEMIKESVLARSGQSSS